MGRIVLPAEYRKRTGIDDLAEVRITEKKRTSTEKWEFARIVLQKLNHFKKKDRK